MSNSSVSNSISEIARGVVTNVGKIIQNTSSVGVGATRSAVTATNVVDNSLKLVESVVNDIKESSHESNQVIKASANAAETAIREATNIIPPVSKFSIESIQTMTNLVRKANMLTTEGVKVVAGAVSILNEFLTGSSTDVAKLIGAPLKAASGVAEGVNYFLSIIFVSPLGLIFNKMKEWEEKTKRDNQYEDIKHMVLMKEEQQKLDHLERLEEDKIKAFKSLAYQAYIKKDELRKIRDDPDEALEQAMQNGGGGRGGGAVVDDSVVRTMKADDFTQRMSHFFLISQDIDRFFIPDDKKLIVEDEDSGLYISPEAEDMKEELEEKMEEAGAGAISGGRGRRGREKGKEKGREKGKGRSERKTRKSKSKSNKLKHKRGTLKKKGKR
jgi:hypothetical protein